IRSAIQRSLILIRSVFRDCRRMNTHAKAPRIENVVTRSDSKIFPTPVMVLSIEDFQAFVNRKSVISEAPEEERFPMLRMFILFGLCWSIAALGDVAGSAKCLAAETAWTFTLNRTKEIHPEPFTGRVYLFFSE